ncbi:hypothetical protein BDW02DRAFT_257747 [Decorospora gaudefroyi]|uniref:Secreted protein n=1 Tax=Decorospora gaudefroyi TaxID=184978 RepID=A0A6A5JWE3_9PLEO|nr:hypothetical protein BDW02DRAFT_257747 [Decorospora gaudefroyi]
MCLAASCCLLAVAAASEPVVSAGRHRETTPPSITPDRRSTHREGGRVGSACGEGRWGCRNKQIIGNAETTAVESRVILVPNPSILPATERSRLRYHQ